MPTQPTKPASTKTALAAKPTPKVNTQLTTTVLGRLGGDPEVKTVKDKLVCEFSIAEDVFTGEKDAQNKAVKQAVWYKVSAWNGLSDRAQYLTKGQEVVVRGTLKVTQGTKREFRDITAHMIRLTTLLPEAGEVPAEPGEELPG